MKLTRIEFELLQEIDDQGYATPFRAVDFEALKYMRQEGLYNKHGITKRGREVLERQRDANLT